MNLSKHVSFRAGVSLAALFAVAIGSFANASPSLSVQKPPLFFGLNPNSGPAPTDPTAIRGQWFVPVAGGLPQFRSHEFHDNALGQGGGVISTKAVHGIVTSIVYLAGPGTNIIGFRIRATIFNDTNTTAGQWQPGSNSHGERSLATTFYVGTLFRPVLVTEFSLGNNASFPLGPIFGTPYTASPGPRIIAINHDMRSWYCFNNTVPPVVGNYYVPGWQFPNIPVGASASRELIYRVIDGGLAPADPRYAAVLNSMLGGRDILSNRTTSLKISNWVESIWLDSGVPYFPFGQSSDASVFHLTPSLVPVPTE